MLKKILIAILVFMAPAINAMETAIKNSDYNYVQKNLKKLTPEQKEIYLELAEKQVKLTSEKLNSFNPNKWDAISLAASSGFALSTLQNIKNFQYLFGEFFDCYETVSKFCSEAALNHLRIDEQIDDRVTCEENLPDYFKEAYNNLWYQALNNFVKNPRYFYSLESKAGVLRRSFLELPQTKIAANISATVVGIALTIWLFKRGYNSHYKNLEFKNSLAIKHLIENAKIADEVQSEPEKNKLAALKEKLALVLQETKTGCAELKTKSLEFLNKTKTQIQNMSNKQKAAALAGTIASASACAIIANKLGNNKPRNKAKFLPMIGWDDGWKK